MSKNEISIKEIFDLIGILHKENAKLNGEGACTAMNEQGKSWDCSPSCCKK